MKLYGLIGKKLDHSFSADYFNNKFRKEGIDVLYKKFPLEDIQEFPELIKEEKNLCGLNVTIPYKESVIEYLDDLDDTAAAVLAVNCIKIIDGKLIGFNTDVIGFKSSLTNFISGRTVEKALVLGTGGASKAVCYVLINLGISYNLVSRQADVQKIPYSDINEKIIKEHKLIINCSPLGMYPDIKSCPDIPYQYLDENHLLYDLVYNPEETIFMKKGKERGSMVCNGLDMLLGQADAAWEIWNS